MSAIKSYSGIRLQRLQYIYGFTDEQLDDIESEMIEFALDCVEDPILRQFLIDERNDAEQESSELEIL
jgi:hypothetical protein